MWSYLHGILWSILSSVFEATVLQQRGSEAVTHGFIIVPPKLQYTYSFCDPGPRPLFEEKTGMKKALVDYIFRRL